MKLEKWTSDDSVNLRIHGELDALSAPRLRSALANIPEHPRNVNLDLEDLQLIDSSGAGAIVWLFKRLRERGSELRVSGISGQPRVVFELLGLNHVFQIA